MPIPVVTSALTQAGLWLFKSLIDRCREYGEATDNAVYHILEHDLQEASDAARLQAAVDYAQEVFAGAPDSTISQEWLQDFAALLEQANGAQETFAQNLWRAYLFGAQSAARVLWDQYEEVQRSAALDGVRTLPRTWGDWVLPMQSFTNVLEQSLAAHNAVFDDLLRSEDLLELIEELPLGEEEAPAGPDPYRVFGDVPFDETIFRAYLSACVHTLGHAEPGRPHRAPAAGIPLGDVYVPVQLVRITDYNRPANTIRYQTAQYTDPDLNAFHAPISHAELATQPGDPISEALAEHPRLLILGGIGSGKTTLLRYLVLQYATILSDEPLAGLEIETSPDGTSQVRLAWPLPVYLDLSQYIEHRQADEPLPAYLARSAQEMTRDEGVGAMLRHLLDAGQCLVLLDGLDQAATDEQRQAVVSAVSDAADEWEAAGNQLVVTSRFEGYDVNPLPADFTGYLLRPFDRSQVNTFLLDWKRTLLRRQRPLSSDEEVMREASTQMLELLHRINSSPKLAELLNTPLLLRLLVDVYRPGMMLQPQRAALYQQVADALIHEWGLPQVAQHRPAVLESEVVTLLGELAYWLHGARPTGMISEHELQQILGNIWSGMHPDASPTDVYEAVGDFIGTLRLHPGVLIELQPQRYGFAYQGLQEYFAARRMVSSYRWASERIRRHLHDPRWNEVITLAIGFTALSSPDNASDLIETAILARGERAVLFGQASSPFESLLKRDLLFGARLLGEGVEARPEVTRAVAEQLMRLWLDGDRGSLGRFTLIFDSARRHLMKLDGTSAGRIAFQIALDACAAADEYRQAYAVDALTCWPSLYEDAQQALLTLPVDEQPTQVRRAMACALTRIRPLIPESYRLLIQLTNDVDEQVSALAQEALRANSPVPVAAMSMWVKYLHSGDAVKRRVGLRRLKQIRALPRPVIAEVLRLLGDEDQTTRRLAVETLANAYELPDDAFITIYRALAGAEPLFRAAALNAFVRPVELPEQVVDQLVRWADDPDAAVRMAAVAALGTCRNSREDVLEALMARLDDAADSVRVAAVEPLVRRGQGHDMAMHRLTHIMADPIPEVREAVARALRHAPRPNHELQRVLSTLLSDRDMEVREAALDTISQLEHPGTDVIEHLVGLVRMPEHPIRSKAVAALARLRELPDWALLALVHALQAYSETLGDEIVECLCAHAPLSLDVLDELTSMAVVREGETRHAARAASNLRSYALEILGYSLDDSTATLHILAEAIESGNDRVRVAAVRGLAHARQIPPDVLEQLKRLLGSSHLEVRAAAGITLGRLARNLPYLPFEGDELLGIARSLAQTLAELPARAAWERESRAQNDVLQALSWVVARSRPVLPRLSARSEDAPGDLDE